MSKISTDSYGYSGLNDLSSVHSGNSYSGAPDEFTYDGSDMLYAWELSSRLNHHVSRGARIEDLHLITSSSAPINSKNSTHAHPSDNYLLENPFDHSTIHFDDYPIKISAKHTVPSLDPPNKPKKSGTSESTITDELLEQFQKGFHVSKSSSEDPHTHFHQLIAGLSQELHQTVDCPERPFHLMKTHINLKLTPEPMKRSLHDQFDNDYSETKMQALQPVESIILLVTGYLNTFSDYDFSFFPKLFMWKGKYLRGSSSCLINIHLYKEKLCDHAFIIEANRISGEAKPFHEFFKSFKRLLLSHLPTEQSQSSLPTLSSSFNSATSSFDDWDDMVSPRVFCSPLYSQEGTPGLHLSGMMSSSSVAQSPLKKISCGDFQKSIEPILNMTKCHFYEVKLEAAKMLCDIANNCDELYLRDAKCIDQIFKAIENLILHHDGFLTVKEQAIVAFGSFIETNHKEILHRMLRSPVLHTLLQLINNPTHENLTYETAQMRRESARILSILASTDATTVLQSLETQQVTNHALNRWFDHVESLKDQRTRLYALRIRELLTNAQLQLSK